MEGVEETATEAAAAEGAAAEAALGDASADCTVDGAGRLVLRLSAPALAPTARPRLLFVLRTPDARADETGHVLDLARRDDGRWHATLGAEPVLAEGRWDPYLVDGLPDGEPRRRLRPGLLDLRALVGREPADGTADGERPLAVRLPYVTVDRRLAVRTWLRTAHAEAGEIRVGDHALTVCGRLYGARLGDGAAALLRRRGAGTVREAALRADGAHDFTFTVDHRDLLAERGPGPGGDGDAGLDVWDAFVRPEAAAPGNPPSRWVRVGRLLDDVLDRKNVFVYPARTLDGVRVRPYYTVDNELAVELAPVPGSTAASGVRRGVLARLRRR
ncbi:hypothetical protein DVA86_29540 [Streptomyces armeniacus]|uniref:Transferase n=1 Tax=Streptomyces armeniacus TaxID=83291 RepID=A0A345XWV4_9ACTN|nr:hypothetical protein DVA86_29540 [Streptomyces armeniacus]